MPSTPAPAALAAFEAACEVLGEVWVGALIRGSAAGGDGGGVGASAADADVRAMSDDGLVRATDALAGVARLVESLQARCAGELASRCAGEEGADLARSRGFSTPERLIANSTGGRYADAVKLVQVGQATAARVSFVGGVMPARHPHLAAALEQGAIGVDVAQVIRRFLDGVELRAGRDDLDDAEALLVERAPLVGVDGVTRLIKQLEAHLDPDGVKPREDVLRARRELRVWEDASGMVNLRGALDPVNGAAVKTAIDALVSAELHRARDSRRARQFGAEGVVESGDEAGDCELGDGAQCCAGQRDGASCDGSACDGAQCGGDSALAEERTIAQMNADALADLARHALGCDEVPTLRQAMVIARVDAEVLASGEGSATIDGIEQPVSVQTVRELLTAAGIAPLYIGTGCTRLELNRAARLFSSEQKVAIAERDGGCAWPGCRRPPAHAQAHHIAWWKRDHGLTNLDNGILLCSHHHHRIHNDGWRVFVRDGRSWFVPPAHLDPEQRPRAGNLAAERDVTHELARRRRARVGGQAARAA